MKLHHCILIALIMTTFLLIDIDQVRSSDKLVPQIAKWYRNYPAAVTMRFDDSQPSHVRIAIPLLNRYGFKGTFMVNPGLSRYQKYKDFWEKEVPAMGHRLGNHTLHHEGARNPAEAEHEVGEVAKLIWRLYPDHSKLMVFASGGGGKKWGGKLWRDADPFYTKHLVQKYHMIDLYDGTHYSHGASRRKAEKLCGLIDKAIENGDHFPITFHNIGRSTFKDILRPLLGGRNLTISENQFVKILDCLNARKDRLWVAPLIEVLKYKHQYNAAALKPIDRDVRSATYELSIQTDATLYDQEMTLILNTASAQAMPKAVYQDQVQIDLYQGESGAILADVKPVTSTIRILY